MIWHTIKKIKFEENNSDSVQTNVARLKDKYYKSKINQNCMLFYILITETATEN